MNPITLCARSTLVNLTCSCLLSILILGCTSLEMQFISADSETIQSLDQYPLPADEALLEISLSDGHIIPPTRIVIDAIDLDSTVVPVGWSQIEIDGETVSQWNVVDYAAGWHLNSARPGQIGNIVLSGHHNISGEVFRQLVDLEAGDQITLYAEDTFFTYQVSEKLILKDRGEPTEVRQANARWIGTFEDERLTLITCWPYNNNTHRLVVVAKPNTVVNMKP